MGCQLLELLPSISFPYHFKMVNLHLPYLVMFILFTSTISLLFPNTNQLVVATLVPLHTSSRWIVNEKGHRVKLACVNWPAHLEPVVVEGLSKQPIDVIVKHVETMGFNCVRFTWPLELATNGTLESHSVRQSFERLGLVEALAGIELNNPWIVDLSIVKAYKAVLKVLQNHDMMVILDNHITTPGWCCRYDDGNGFFGDKYFDPKDWLHGLQKMAKIAKSFPNIVGMSLRNELLRGPRANKDDWYKYMEQGAETVHATNPNVLIILSGLRADKDLSFLHRRPINVSFNARIVFELHWYSFSNSNSWVTGNPNERCGRITKNVMNSGGFLTGKGFPMFISEFGVDQRGANLGDNRYLSCFMAAAVDQDWDFAAWALQGSYYLRQGKKDREEVYGFLDFKWSAVRNMSLLNRISVLQTPFRGPGWKQSTPHKVMFHPLTGTCINKTVRSEPVRLGPCLGSQRWTYTAKKTLTVSGTDLVLQVTGPHEPVTLEYTSIAKVDVWETVSDSMLHFATKSSNGSDLCLDVDRKGFVVANPCKCLDNRDIKCEPASQWFKLVERTML